LNQPTFKKPNEKEFFKLGPNLFKTSPNLIPFPSTGVPSQGKGEFKRDSVNVRRIKSD
jgi:hypothetical protein